MGTIKLRNIGLLDPRDFWTMKQWDFGMPLLLKDLGTYVPWTLLTMGHWEFWGEWASRTMEFVTMAHWQFAVELSDPIADIITCMVSRGEFPDIWKSEMVTPAPKVYPPPTVNDLRKISGLTNLSKTAEKVLGITI